MTEPEAGRMDDRGRSGPCEGAYLTAWNLYVRHYTVPEAIEVLARGGHDSECGRLGHTRPVRTIGRSTFYVWRDEGRRLYYEDEAREAEALNRDHARLRQNGTLDALMTMAQQRIEKNPDEVWLGLRELRGLVREYAILAGTDAPRRSAVSIETPEPPTPDPRLAAEVRATEADVARKTAARRNGARPDETESHSP